jgi:hypothetical protein
MDKYEMLQKLFGCFPNSFVNGSGEFIAHQEANQYFIFDNCETELDVKCKVIEWFSRGAYKSEPFNSNYKNACLHDFMRNGINEFLGTNFTHEDMEDIYTYLGNAIKHEKTIEFIESGYDMTFFNQFRNQLTLC